jgi:hypothetical protein
VGIRLHHHCPTVVQLVGCRASLDSSQRYNIIEMMTEKEIDELKSLMERIAAVLAQQQRVINERNIKSIHKAQDFVRVSGKT